MVLPGHFTEGLVYLDCLATPGTSVGLGPRKSMYTRLSVEDGQALEAHIHTTFTSHRRSIQSYPSGFTRGPRIMQLQVTNLLACAHQHLNCKRHNQEAAVQTSTRPAAEATDSHLSPGSVRICQCTTA